MKKVEERRRSQSKKTRKKNHRRYSSSPSPSSSSNDYSDESKDRGNDSKESKDRRLKKEVDRSKYRVRIEPESTDRSKIRVVSEKLISIKAAYLEIWHNTPTLILILTSKA